MSHVTSTKDISLHPGATGVTQPTDPVVKAKDIDRKMTLYGVIEAFRQGKYPSNKQIDLTLDYTLSHSPIPVEKLSTEGKMLVQDFQNIIRTAKTMVSEKNADELFQNFLFHTRDVDYSKGNLKDINMPVGMEDLNRDGQQAAEHLRTLGKLIFTNSEARKLLKDFALLGRDMAADAAAKVSDLARPDDAALANVDDPAPSNQWVGPNGETRSHNEPAPSTGLQENKERAQETKEQLKADAQAEADESHQRVAHAADSNVNGDAAPEDQARQGAAAGKEQGKGEAKRVGNKLLAKIPDEHKDRAKELMDNAHGYLKEKFPEERRDRFIYRLKKVIVENQRHRDYQDAIEFFLEMAENYGSHAKNVSGTGADKGLDVRNDQSFKQAETELRTLLERFANGQSSQPIFDAVNQIYTDANNDDQLRAWFSRLDTYVRDCLQEPGYIMKDESDRVGRELWNEGKKFFNPNDPNAKYGAHKDRLFDSVQDFFTAYADDPLNVQLGEDVKKLTKNLLFDSDGGLKFKAHLWHDVRAVIVPSLIQHIGYVPIPRIEYSDKMLDIVIENLTLESQNMLPNTIEIEAKNYFRMSPYSAIQDQSKHSFWISFGQIQADLKDVAFHFKKKSGFPKLSDSGLADVFIGGSGISGKIHVESTGKKHHAFKIVEVKVKIDKLKFTIRDAKHTTLYSTLRPLATGLIKKQIAKATEDGITSALEQLDAQLSDISERYETAKNQDSNEGSINALKSAYNDKQTEAAQAKAQAEEKAPSGKFQITSRRDSKIVDWSSPQSIVEKQGAKQDAAQKTVGSDPWKSPAFDII